jgi:CRISPR-associated protein Cas5d
LIAPDADLPPSITETRDLGFMLWDIDHQANGRPSLFFRAALENA